MTGHRRKSRERSLTELVACADQLMAERFRESAKSPGLSVTEGRVLGALTESDGIRMIRIGDVTLSKQVTLSKAVDRLERAQFVQRRMPSDDRRGTLVYLKGGRRVATPQLAQVRKDARAVTRALGPATSDKIKRRQLALLGCSKNRGGAPASSTRAESDSVAAAAHLLDHFARLRCRIVTMPLIQTIVDLLRQSVFGHLAGYEDANGAERLCRDSAMRAKTIRGVAGDLGA